MTNESGAVAATLLYDAWGNERASTGSNQGRYRFTGAERDPTTELYHMGARFYDPTIGRWLSEDPVQDKHLEPATLNFYTYVDNNPVRFTDPGGESLQDQVMEWLKQGEEYAKQKLKEFYDRMVDVYVALSELFGANTLVLNLGVLTALALSFTFKGVEMGNPGMPSPSSYLGQLVAHLLANPGAWRMAAATAGYSGSHRGAISVKIIFERLSDKAVFGYHLIGRDGKVLHAHFRGGSWEELLKWLYR